MKFLMCRPEFFDIEYEINPWMNIQIKANKTRAISQWEELYKTIRSCGAQVELVQAIRGLPDMCFTANAGFFHQGHIVLANFRVIERKGEVPYFQAWFEKEKFKVLNRPGYDQSAQYFEGAGDLLSAGDKIFAGYGFRSEKEFFHEASYLNKDKIIYCELVNPHFYHIDTCFCPLNETQAIWYPAAFSKESREKMSSEIELFEVIDEEATRFACNSVVIENNVIIPDGSPHLANLLEKQGFTVHSVAIDEYIKSGGACKCLTMRLD